MNRNDFINLRRAGHVNKIYYLVYKDYCDRNKKTLEAESTFYMALNLWINYEPFAKSMLKNTLKQLDNHFETTLVTDSHHRILKVL